MNDTNDSTKNHNHHDMKAGYDMSDTKKTVTIFEPGAEGGLPDKWAILIEHGDGSTDSPDTSWYDSLEAALQAASSAFGAEVKPLAHA